MVWRWVVGERCVGCGKVEVEREEEKEDGDDGLVAGGEDLGYDCNGLGEARVFEVAMTFDGWRFQRKIFYGWVGVRKRRLRFGV